jgi:hypothetical protein
MIERCIRKEGPCSLSEDEESSRQKIPSVILSIISGMKKCSEHQYLKDVQTDTNDPKQN